MKNFCLFITLLLVLYGSLGAQRLPDIGVIPENYKLQFTPDLVNATFTGDETIRVRVNQPTTRIVLNSAEIEIQQVTINAGGNTQTAKVEFQPLKEQATITVADPVPAGPADIHINFTGILNDQLRGFYLSKTQRRRYAVTQLEATDARRAFPSFDQPAFKATYDITLIIDEGDTAISNGSIVSDTAGPGTGKHTVVFSTTPKMSPYLVAMMVGDFQCVSGDADSIPIRVCSVPENKPYLGFAETAAENILKFYERYYTIEYPFKKLDIIAFPDFSAGAMENTAAITYREEMLLINEKTASVTQRKMVVDVLAHEMAHQWFGDLVTMKWWNDIWLNEGFATWMSNKPTEAWKPEWNASMDEIQGTAEALNTDSIATIRAIRADAETPGEIAALFDGIAYGKAGAVLRMIESYVGADRFRDGVNLYLSRNAYGNATAEDFWTDETVATHKPIDKIMATFINQAGAPLVSVKTRCASGHTDVTLSQRRYFADRDKLESGSPERWQIPVCLKIPGSKTASCELLTEPEHTFQIKGCPAWIFANAGGRGYYQVSYDSEMNRKIAIAAEARQATEAYMKDPSSVDPTIVPNAVALAASKGDAGLYDRFLEHLKSAHSPDEFYMYLKNLGNFADPALALRTAQFYLTPEVKGQDVLQILALVGNPDTQKPGWEFLKAHFAEFQDKLGAELGGGLTRVANSFCDAQLRDDSQTFLAAQNIPGAQRVLANARERVNACVGLRTLQQANLTDFLKAQK